MNPADRRAVIVELRGRLCACGARKTLRQTFCRSHYFRLPAGMREAIYQPIPAYFEAYEEACRFLNLLPAKAPAEPLTTT